MHIPVCLYPNIKSIQEWRFNETYSDSKAYKRKTLHESDFNHWTKDDTFNHLEK